MMSETIKPFSGPCYEKNSDRCKDGETPCALCGKACKGDERDAVHVIEGGAEFATQAQHEGAEAINDAGDMGEWPVGSSCAKKLRKAGVYVFQANWN